MNRFYLTIATVLLLLTIWVFPTQAQEPFEYLSPRPQAEYVSAGTTIAVRHGDEVDTDSITTDLFTVVGNESGLHTGETILADDNKTVIFRPNTLFSPAEVVTVTIAAGLQTTGGITVSGTTYTFTVSKLPLSEMRQRAHQHQIAQFNKKEAESISASQTFSETDTSYATLPDDFPAITITVPATGTAEGYLFISTLSLPYPDYGYTLIFDELGDPVYYQRLDQLVADFRKQPDGSLTYCHLNLDVVEDGLCKQLDATYREVAEIQAGNGYYIDLHGLHINEAGHVLLQIYDHQEYDMSQLVAGGVPTATVIGAIVQELDPSGNVIFEWRSWDHIPVLDVSDAIDLTTSNVDVTHINSIEWSPDGHILISNRNLDELTKINRDTAEVMWRLGGKQNEFRFVNDPSRPIRVTTTITGLHFSHQHDARQLPNGNITLYDNGNSFVEQYSKAIEYAIDEDNKVITKVWEYRHEPADIFAPATGNAQRLANGNTVVGWGGATIGGVNRPIVTEVKPDGSKAFEMYFAKTNSTYRVFRQIWEGQPVVSPTLVVREEGGLPVLHYSWNGATNVSSYQIYRGETADTVNELIATQAKTGFETITKLESATDACHYYQVMPLDNGNNQTIASNVVFGGGDNCNDETVNLVKDGGFELGEVNPHWQQASTNAAFVICNPSCSYDNISQAYRGEHWVQMAGTTTKEEASVHQRITVPIGTIKKATLTFRVKIAESSRTGSDTFNVSLDGTPLFSLLDTEVNDYRTFTNVTLDVTDYISQSHTLRFEAMIEAGNITTFYLDEVYLEVEGRFEEDASPFKYHAPRPQARYVSAGTTIAVRQGDEIDSDSVQSALFNVVGTASGEHTGDVILADDKKTVIFKPNQPFQPSERVTVTIAAGLKTMVGQTLAGTSYSFTISALSLEAMQTRVRQKRGVGSHVTAGNEIQTTQTVTQQTRYATLPADFPIVTTTVPANGTDEGLIFIGTFKRGAPSATPYMMIMDDMGEPVYYKQVEIRDFKKQPTGHLTYFDRGDGNLYIMDDRYTEVGQIKAGNGYLIGYHDLQMNVDGHALLQIYDYQIVDMTMYGGPISATVTGAIIQELDPSGNVIFEWRSWDHFAIDEVSDGVDLTADSSDVTHINSLEWDDDGHILASMRNMDEVTKINRETADLVWRLGGEKNQFTFVDETLRPIQHTTTISNLAFSYQHDARRIANGNLTLYDNGNSFVEQYSRGVEYALDEENLTATKVWEYRNQPEDIYGRATGSVQRLPNGNSLIAWGGLGQGAARPPFVEVKPDGSKAYEIYFANNDSTYRAFRQPWTGNPVDPPVLVMKEEAGVKTLHYSWNGATNVTAYRVYGGKTAQPQTLLATTPKTGFETTLVLTSPPTGCYYYQIMPLDEAGNTTISSTALFGGDDSCNQVVTLDPMTSTTAVFSQVNSVALLNTILQADQGVVSDTTTLFHTDVVSISYNAPANMAFAEMAFELLAYQNGAAQPDFMFNKPITIQLTYNADQLGKANEATLMVYAWDNQQQTWSTEGIEIVTRDTDNNRLTMTTTHLTLFAVFGRLSSSNNNIYLPVILSDQE